MVEHKHIIIIILYWIVQLSIEKKKVFLLQIRTVVDSPSRVFFVDFWNSRDWNIFGIVAINGVSSMFVCPQHINTEKANGGQIFITVQTKFDRNIYEKNDTETIEYIPVKVKLSSSILCHYCAYIPMCSPNGEFELQKIHIRSPSANRQIAYLRWFRPPERTLVFIWHKSSCISTNKLWQWNRVYRLRHVIKSVIQVNEIHNSRPRVALFDILFYYSDPGNISVHESIGPLAHEYGNHKPVDVILDCSMVVRTSHCGAQIHAMIF